MGNHKNIGEDAFPMQGEFYQRKVLVGFHYRECTLPGEIVRDDLEDPRLTIIALEDGRYILGTECQYEIIEEESISPPTQE